METKPIPSFRDVMTDKDAAYARAFFYELGKGMALRGDCLDLIPATLAAAARKFIGESQSGYMDSLETAQSLVAEAIANCAADIQDAAKKQRLDLAN